MRLGGLIKSSTLDYPALISAVIFTQGCNYTCPYCHNPHLLRPFGLPLAEEEIFTFLRKRRPLLDAVVISGGEPTIQTDLAEFCKRIRGLGYKLKLDTNGSKPEVLASLIERKLINYVALDVKADPANYPKDIAPHGQNSAIQESINLLRKNWVPHEFRCTAVSPFINKKTIKAIAKAVSGKAPLYIQQLRFDNKILYPDFISNYEQASLDDLNEFKTIASKYLPVFLRGVSKKALKGEGP